MVNTEQQTLKPSLRKDSGFSLVELIVSLVLLTIIFGVMFRVLAGHKATGVKTELYTKAIFLGNEMMHQVLSEEYDENATSPWTGPDSLGLDADDITYDDVDDFAGYSSSIPDFAGFTKTVRVFYVSPTGSLDDSVYTKTDMKKIIVTVTHAEIEPVVLGTIISSHY